MHILCPSKDPSKLINSTRAQSAHHSPVEINCTLPILQLQSWQESYPRKKRSHCLSKSLLKRWRCQMEWRVDFGSCKYDAGDCRRSRCCCWAMTYLYLQSDACMVHSRYDHAEFLWGFGYCVMIPSIPLSWFGRMQPTSAFLDIFAHMFLLLFSTPTHPQLKNVSLFVVTILNILCSRKDQKKVDKLEAQIPYHEGRGNKEEVEKIKQQVAAIWTKTREAALA